MGVCEKTLTRFLKQYGIRRTKTRRDTTSFLYYLLELALNERDFEEIRRVKATLKDLVVEDAWGVAVRSRVSSETED